MVFILKMKSNIILHIMEEIISVAGGYKDDERKMLHGW